MRRIIPVIYCEQQGNRLSFSTRHLVADKAAHK